MERPASLFPLFSKLTGLAGIGPRLETRFGALEIKRPRDLLFHLPSSLIERRLVKTVDGIEAGQFVTVEVVVQKHVSQRKKAGSYRVFVRDAQISFALVFFHVRKAFQDFLLQSLPCDARRVVSGRLEIFNGEVQITHPEFMVAPEKAHTIPSVQRVYPAAVGLTQKTISGAIDQVLAFTPEFPEWIDRGQMAKAGWPSWKAALDAAHKPMNGDAFSPNTPARARLAYDDFFAHQVMLILERARHRALPGRSLSSNGVLGGQVLESLPFAPTKAQLRAVEEITADLRQPLRMNRLLQGDVGAGKTLVAFLALLHAVEAGGQGALMAPTEILALQHLAGLGPLAEIAGVSVESLTGRDRGKLRVQKLAALAAGEVDILVGTHALFQRDVAFRDLCLAVIDEQHRFGVRERIALGAKNSEVDVLVMTATPIPRSLAITQYGDMDLSILDEKPPGRLPIKTAMVSLGRLNEVVERLRAIIAKGQRAYWVCPLVDDSELTDLTAATTRFEFLRAALGEENVALVHGQMVGALRDQAMASFKRGDVKVLVATTAIEVGVDVPEAVIMVIERAENFGLAQLHQLRGRVGRGAEASSCLLLYQSPLGQTARRRLSLLRDTEDGFRIAEEDLSIRGAGNILGTEQSGLPKFRIADIETQAGLMATARRDAQKLIHEDPKLETPRGQATQVLLALMEYDRVSSLLSAG